MKSYRMPQTTTRSPIVVAIGDVHGAYNPLDRLLGDLHVAYDLFTDETHREVAPHATLVFLGDYVDRGPRAYDVLIRLASLKAASPDRVVVILGNHEAMALDDLEAVWQNASRVGSEKTIRAIEALLADRIRGVTNSPRRHRYHRAWPHDSDQNGEGSNNPTTGAVADDFLIDGTVGRFLRSLEVARVLEYQGHRILFSHGDVPSGFEREFTPTRDRNAITRAVEAYAIARESSSPDRPLVHNDFDAPWGGLLWSREYTESDFVDNRADHQARAHDICASCGVDYIVSGHTTTSDGHIASYGGRIFHADIGMVYGRAPRALVIEREGIHAFGNNETYLLASFQETCVAV
jgi:hypothetical protein